MLELIWTFDAVEERLVEAARLWRRSPWSGHHAGGRGPWAADAPWNLMTREARADAGRMAGMDLWRVIQEDDEREARERPVREDRGLTTAEVALRDQASAWLELVGDRDRRLVALAVAEQAATGRRVDWMRMRAKVGVERGANGLRMRYERALGRLAETLNRRRVKAAA